MPKQTQTVAQAKRAMERAGAALVRNPMGNKERRDWTRARDAHERMAYPERFKGLGISTSTKRAYARLEAKGCGRLWKRFHSVNAAIGDTAASMHPNYPRGPVLKKKYGAKLKRLYTQDARLRKQLRKSGCV